MKKFYLKQQVFSFRDRFTIKNEAGNDVYFISGSIFSISKKLMIHDTSGQEVARIEAQIFKLLPRFTLFINEQKVAIIKKKLTFLKEHYELDGTKITATGDFLAMNFTLNKNRKTIASVKKAWFSWGDSYEISILDPTNELAVIGLVLAIDYISHQ